MVHEIENFQGVYLLYNVNPKYKGRTYIGYTVNPNRRIRQHNTGKQAGGAWRTDGKGPWEMVLIVHGFPNGISALRFEWAWQHPDVSRRLRLLPKKSSKENAYQYRFRVVSNMLRTGPWCRLPLTIRWLKQEYRMDFAANLLPPVHMAITFGPVTCKKVTEQEEKNQKKSVSSESDDDLCSLSQVTKIWRCAVCRGKLKADDNTVKCIHPGCCMVSHLICLSTLFLEDSPDEVIPVDGKCPNCHRMVLWGNLIRMKQGCYQDMSEGSKSEEEEEHWANLI